jgi:excisionase family DNA binding protein
MVHLLTQREAALVLRLSERTLERLRVSGGGPSFVKAGRSVRYRERDLEAWIAERVVSSTSQEVNHDRNYS